MKVQIPDTRRYPFLQNAAVQLPATHFTPIDPFVEQTAPTFPLRSQRSVMQPGDEMVEMRTTDQL